MAFLSKNPFTRKVLKEVSAWSKDQSMAAVRELHAEYSRNRKLGPQLCKEKVRAELLALADSLDAHKAELAALLTTEIGKPIVQAEGEITKTVGHCKFYASKIDEFLAPRLVKTDPAAKTGYWLDPLGVALKVVPFNFPVWIALKMMVPTMLSGNTALVRPASSTPQSFELLQRVFDHAGLRSLRVGFTDAAHTGDLLAMPEVAGISFTGSTPSGAAIAEAAGRHLKRCVLELGGNDPFIVCADADLDLAASLAARSRLATSGQVCFSAKRFLVDRSRLDAFAAKLIAELGQYPVGDPTQRDTKVGPLARDDLTSKYLAQLAATERAGDRLLHCASQPQGNLVWPAVYRVADPAKSLLATEEVFGPCFALLATESTEHAIALANASQYGLGATIVSRDVKAAEAAARLLDAGLTYVNGVVGSDSALPCGGVKHSGYGRDLAAHGVESFANVKTFSIRA